MLCLLVLTGSWARMLAAQSPGQMMYEKHCVRCHGAMGEGVAGKYDEALSGDRSLEELTAIIHKTMPEQEPERVQGEDAKKVAAYMYDAFYSSEARSRLRPARVELSRLTSRQYQESVADLFATWLGETGPLPAGGLQASYYDSRSFKRDKRVVSRQDPTVDFQFGEGSPDEGIQAEEFSMSWEGSLLVEDSGDYEFMVRSENGVRLWVNDTQEALIDAWVASGSEPREHRASLTLLGGRSYSIRLNFFKFKDKTASVQLRWRTPGRTWEVIPARSLSPKSSSPVYVVQNSFPADDGSSGYVRGTHVSKLWDAATTQAGIDAAGYVERHLDRLAGTRSGAEDRAEKIRGFCTQFATRAFRCPLEAEEKELYIDHPLDSAPDLETGAKRSVLMVLKSPRFLFPEIPGGPLDDLGRANRLALTLWDSLPDATLLKAANQGQLRTPEQVQAQARRMTNDPRTKAKLREFFHHWLHMEEAESMDKDGKAYPGFDAAFVSQLRTSLELFIEDVVWGETSDFRQLLLSDELHLNERLADFYGLEGAYGDAFEKVRVDPTIRSGVVTHPYLLSTLAYYKSSSPIHRGVFLTRNILGRSLKPPPMAIEFMDGRFDPSLTMREKVAELTRPAACQNCHSIINPLGFSLEHYDAAGRYRTEDNEKPVDATSVYLTPEGEQVKLQGARDLATYAASNAAAQRGFVEQLFHHLVKQPVNALSQDTSEQLRQAFEADQFHVRHLLAACAVAWTLHEPVSAPSKQLSAIDSSIP